MRNEDYAQKSNIATKHCNNVIYKYDKPTQGQISLIVSNGDDKQVVRNVKVNRLPVLPVEEEVFCTYGYS